MMFVYLHDQTVIISEMPMRALRHRYRKLELLSSFHRVQDALRYADQLHLPIINLTKRHFSGITPEGRERMRDTKRGKNNPNAAGLSLMHRRKISIAMKKQRGEHHPMWNKKLSPQHRRNISVGMMMIPKRRWALDAQGDEHLLPADHQLPPGWTWGRRRGVTTQL
jgi:hypothetical protein